MYTVSIAALEITNARGRILLRITPNAYPCSKVVAKKEPGDESLVEFVQVRKQKLNLSKAINLLTNGAGPGPWFPYTVTPTPDE